MKSGSNPQSQKRHAAGRVGAIGCLLIVALAVTGCALGGAAPSSKSARLRSGASSQTRPSNWTIRYVHMNNAKCGWALGITPSKTLVVLRTTDGARGWASTSLKQVVHVNLPSYWKQRGFPGVTAAFPSCTSAKVLAEVQHGGSLQVLSLSSDDGGSTWNTGTFPFSARFQLGKAYLASANGPMYALFTSTPSSGSVRMALFKSKKGSSTWERVKVAGLSEHPATGLRFVSPSLGWLTELDYGPQPYNVFKTTDGGRHWSRKTLPVPQSLTGKAADAYPPVFGAHGNGTMLLAFHIKSGLGILSYRTANDGVSWSPTHVLRTFIGVNELIESTPTPTAIWVTGPEAKYLYGTQDGGLSWTKRPLLAGCPGGAHTVVAFLDKDSSAGSTSTQ